MCWATQQQSPFCFYFPYRSGGEEQAESARREEEIRGSEPCFPAPVENGKDFNSGRPRQPGLGWISGSEFEPFHTVRVDQQGKKNPSPPTSNVPNVSKHRRDFLINFKYCINGNEEKYLFGSWDPRWLWASYHPERSEKQGFLAQLPCPSWALAWGDALLSRSVFHHHSRQDIKEVSIKNNYVHF